jgi:hypothetical protein
MNQVVYNVLKFLLSIFVGVFYSEIEIRGLENIPDSTQPVRSRCVQLDLIVVGDVCGDAPQRSHRSRSYFSTQTTYVSNAIGKCKTSYPNDRQRSAL